VKQRLYRICEVATKLNLPLLVDAEQSFRQPAVDYLAFELIKKFNAKKPLVYNTYQMYLKNALPHLSEHLELAKKHGVFLGAKVVRGAYIVTETKRANDNNSPYPILPSKTAADHSYNVGVGMVLGKIANNEKVGVVIATHNFESVVLAAQQTRELKLGQDHPNIAFAQLRGMADHLTMGLGLMHFNICKLLPFGPVETVLPYLIRRVQENSSVLGGTQLERQMLWHELKRRFWLA